MSHHTVYMPDSAPEHLQDFAKCDRVIVQVFPDGETAVSIPLDLFPGDDITLIGECSSAVASETFLAAAYEIAALGPKSFTVINTYFRHARSERATDGNAVMAKFQARQWSGLGRVFPGVHLEFVDLHKDTVMYYFEGAVFTHNLTRRPMLRNAIYDSMTLVNPVYATVDEGGVFEARQLAMGDKVGFAHIEKKRLSGSATKIINVLGDDVAGRDVIIFDDIISTGSSMALAARAFKDRGANRVIAAATHGVFVGDAPNNMIPYTDRIYVTDSHPNARKTAYTTPNLIVVKLPF